MSGSRVALLAEDETDCDAVGELVRRIASDVGNPRVGVKKYWGNGCSRLRKKAEQKMKLMAADGCAAAILVHDLLCAKRCPAFRALAHFVRDVFSTETPGLQGRSGGVATPGAGA